MNWARCIDLLYRNGAEKVWFEPVVGPNGSSLFMSDQVFTDKNGDLRMSLHVMFTASYEGRMPFFLHIDDSDGHLKIK